MRTLLDFTTKVAIAVVLVGVGWAIFNEVTKSESVHAAASFAMVDHQTGQVGESLGSAGSLISTEVAGVASITNLSSLLDRWSRRYQRAQSAYHKFDTAIQAAEVQAESYFEAQRALTSSFHSDDLRAEAQAEDDAEFRQYEQWKEQAHSVRAEALKICTVSTIWILHFKS